LRKRRRVPRTWSASRRRAREVPGGSGKDHGVRYADLLVRVGADLGREDAHVHHGSLDLTDANPLAAPERAREGEDEAAGGLTHDAGRAERQHHAQEHAETLEGIAAGTGQVRIRHGQGEEPDGRGDETTGGLHHFRVDPEQPIAAGLDASRDRADDSRDEMGEGGDDHDHHETRHLVDAGRPDLRDDAGDVAGEIVRPRARVGEEREDEAEPLLDENGHEEPEDDLAERPNRAQDPRPFLQPEMQAPSQLGVDSSPEPEPHPGENPHRETKHHRRRRGNAKLSQELPARPRLPGGRDGLLQALGNDDLGLIEGLAVDGVEVALEDPEGKDPVDQHFETLIRPYDPDSARSALGQGLANALAP